MLIETLTPTTNENQVACDILRELLLRRSVIVRFEERSGLIEHDRLDWEEFQHQPISNLLTELEEHIRILKSLTGTTVSFYRKLAQKNCAEIKIKLGEIK